MKSLSVLRGVIGLLIFVETRTHAWSVLRTTTNKNAQTLTPLPPTSSQKTSCATKTRKFSSKPFRIADGLSSSVKRRDILGAATAFSAVAVSVPYTVLASPQKAIAAAAPLDAGEAIRRGASSIPGYGSSDVFYPESFAGSWKMTRDVEFPSSASSSASSSAPPLLRLTYPVRFIQSIEDGAVVADRGYNQAELEAALANRGSASTTSPMVLSYEWVPNNPNIVMVALTNGTKKEIKVTKRATERTEDTVSSSEFQRITQEDTNQATEGGGPGGIPQISARRVVSKWKKVDDSTLEGIEIVYAVGGGGDPLSTSLILPSKTAAPTILSKSRLFLVR